MVDVERNAVQSLEYLFVGLAPSKEEVPEFIDEEYYLRVQPFDEQKRRDK